MSIGKKRVRRGFSLAELLVALVITGILLAAIATAFNASAVNYRENELISRLMGTARQALLRITNDLRTATAVVPSEAANQCSLILADGVTDITYRFNSGDGKLYLVTNNDLSDDDYVLCDNVAAMSFTKETGIDEGVTFVKSVQISMTVSIEGRSQTISTASQIRRNTQL